MSRRERGSLTKVTSSFSLVPVKRTTIVLVISIMVCSSLMVLINSKGVESFPLRSFYDRIEIGPDLPISISSPDGSISMGIFLEDDESGGNDLCYNMTIDGTQVVGTSKLGIQLGVGTEYLGSDLNLLDINSTSINRTYTLVSGEMDEYPEVCNQVMLTFNETTPDNRTLVLKARAYDQGISFRYSVPSQDGITSATITQERTQFSLGSMDSCHAEYGVEGTYSKVDVNSVKQNCEVPLTVETSSGHLLSIGEADLMDHSRMMIKPSLDPNTLQVQMYSTANKNAPFMTPWRVILAGRSFPDLANNAHILYSMCPDPVFENTSWIRQGKAFRDTSLTTSGCKAIIDFCSDRGMQYVHLDAGWYGDEHSTSSDASTVSAPNLNMTEVIRYGKENDVGVIVYVNNKALSRHYTTLFPLYEQWGLAGVKFGFVDGRSQAGINQIQDYLEKAAEHHLVVDIHDNLRPTGLTRTYPNLLTMEGVRGQEHFPTSTHNTNLPFTRGLAGPIDYTPRSKANTGKTTIPHQLALPIVYHSPLTYMFWYNRPSNLVDRKELEMWKDLPTIWNESRFLSGGPGDHASVLRRSVDIWYYAFLNGLKHKDMELDLSFLDDGVQYQALIIQNGPNSTIKYTNYSVNNDFHLSESIPPKGGLTIRFTPQEGSPPADIVTYPPRIPRAMDLEIEEDTVLIDQVVFHNGAQDLVFQYNALPAMVSLDTDAGSITYNPGNDDVGQMMINISVSDGDDLIGWYNLTIFIENVNDPPIIEDMPPYILVTSGRTFNILPRAVDIDPTNDTLTWSMNTSADFMSINSATGRITGDPGPFVQGAYSLEILVEDDKGGFTSVNLTVFVESDGEMIFISTRLDVLTVLEDHLFIMDMEVWSTMGRPENVTWSMETDCPFLELDGSTGELKGIPRDGEDGEYVVNVSVNDDDGHFDSITFLLISLSINDVPRISPVQQVHVMLPGEELVLDLEVEDPDHTQEELVWKLESGPDFVTLNGSSGSMRASPTEDDIGINQVTIFVSDPVGARSYVQIMIYVAENTTEIRTVEIPVNGTMLNITIPEWNYSTQVPFPVNNYNFSSDVIVVPVNFTPPVDDDDEPILKEDEDKQVISVGDWVIILLLMAILFLAVMTYLKRSSTNNVPDPVVHEPPMITGQPEPPKIEE